MAGNSCEGPNSDQKLPKNTPSGDGADSDEEEFHDARFPAEEEAVSCPSVTAGKGMILMAMTTATAERSSRYQTRGKPAF
jgi:hypothetical protein